MGKVLSVEQRIQRANVQLMRSAQFCGMSGILMCGTNTVVDDDSMTACTNGWDVRYGRKFMSDLDEKTFNWVVVHENMHKALKQLTVWRRLFEQDADCANAAADHVINLLIESMDSSRVVTARYNAALYDESFRGMDTGQVFKLLQQQGKGQNKSSKGQPGQSQGNGGQESFDSHEWGADKGLSEADKAAREQAIDQAMRQGAIVASKNGGANAARTLNGLLKPKVDWREQLHEFMVSVTSGKELSTWRKPNRRWLGQGMMMPSYYSENMGTIVVAIDASGSIKQENITLFASELVGVCEAVSPEKVFVVWWHHRIANVQEFVRGEYETMPDKLRPAGSGGTDPQCVVGWMEQERIEPECVLFLTDGYVAAWPAPLDVPTLWAITTNVVAPHGVTIKLEG